MQKSLFSDQWYQIADIKPRLKKNAEIHRHNYRDQIWYVLQDHISGHYHRFSPAAYLLISKMDGKRTIQKIWEEAVISLDEEDVPTQTDVAQLMGQLHSADVLASDVPPDILEMFKRFSEQRKTKWKQRLTNPLGIKIPLVDPDRFLTKFQALFRPVFSVTGVILWLGITGYALLLAWQHWPALTENIRDTVLTPTNLILMAVLFPLIKALHELGHAFAAKVWGGEVHEIGVMLLVFVPVPYVDASCSSAFRERYRRIIVGAAGMMVEVTIAALALIYWINADPGFSKTVAYNIVLIAGVSTLFFNANPLLRFDGYYILADILEIPNLYQRSQKFFTYLIKKYLLRLKGETSPASAPGEIFWFTVYGLTSYPYRVFITVVITLFIASEFFIFGILLAMFSLFNMFILPLFKACWFMCSDNRVQRKKIRSFSICGFAIFALIALIAFVPLPHWTNAEGIIWLPEKSMVRAGTDCYIKKFYVEEGTMVSTGDSLIECVDPLLEKEIKVRQAQLTEQETNYITALSKDPITAELSRKNLENSQAELNRVREHLAELNIISKTDGRFEVPLARDLIGQFVRKGDVIAYVINTHNPTIRAVITQHDIGFVRDKTRYIEARRSSRVDKILLAGVKREVPGASNTLPSKVLGTQGGGAISVDPRDMNGVTAFQKVFQFDLYIQQPFQSRIFDERIYLRFHHEKKPLFQQLYRDVRLLLLEQLGV